mgnify:CR=1 FL=1
MALPQLIKVNDVTGASSPDLIDNDLNAGIKQPLLDIFGIPDNTSITVAGTVFVAGGLDEVIFRNAVADASATGRLRRNAANLTFHDGTAARTTVWTATAQTLTDKTLTAPAISAPVLSGTATGTYTLAGTPTITAPAISAPVLSGSTTGTYTLAGTPTITSPTITSPTINSKTITSPAVVLTGDVGTIALFQQTAAPTGWTKVATQNDKCLRVVSGAAGTGGATAFSSVFGAGKVVGGTAISVAQMPAHQHTADSVIFNAGTSSPTTGGAGSVTGTSQAIPLQGGGATHDHTLSLDLQFVDIILAQKD